MYNSDHVFSCLSCLNSRMGMNVFVFCYHFHATHFTDSNVSVRWKLLLYRVFFALVFGFVYVARPIFVFTSLTFEDIMQSKSKVWIDLMHLNSDLNFSQCCPWKRTDGNSPVRWQKFGWQKFAFTLLKLTYIEPHELRWPINENVHD